MSSQLGSTIRRFRRRAGLTQQQVADLAGLSVAALRDLEQGRVASPRVATLRSLGEGLRLSMTDTDELLRFGRVDQVPALDLWLQVLGPLAMRVNGEPVTVGSARQRLLLGALCLDPYQPCSHESLTELLWGPHPPANVVELLRMHVSRLRRRLPNPDALVATQGGYQLRVSDNQLDLLLFRRLVGRARQAREQREPERECRLFAEAVALWRGEALADLLSLREHPAVVGLRMEWQRTVVEYAGTATALGRHQEVLPLLERLVAADPLHEAAHARLMLAFVAAGRMDAARSVYEQIRRRLAEELGTDPGSTLAEAWQVVRRRGDADRLAGTDVRGASGSGVDYGGGDTGRGVDHPKVMPVSVYRHLPLDLTDFTGREAELDTLLGWVAPDGEDNSTAITIAAIEGMGGVGKTRLAVHLAHRLLAAGRYADCQLYVDLRGHADAPPADPSAVLASFLLLLDVPGDRIPEDLAGRAALFRDRVFGKRVLLLLDNAASDQQVLPLLPASPTALVLVTSRRSLALDGARVLPLEVFSHQEAERLLAAVVGTERAGIDPLATWQVVELCGRLPLAVSLVARRLRSRPGWRLADLAERLEQARDKLGELAAGTRQLRAAFDLSYLALGRAEQRLFRLLGLHPHQEFTLDSAAALAGSTSEEVRGMLDLLVDEHVVTVVTGERYRLHDLLGDYAGQLVQTEESVSERRAALTRVLDYYLHATAQATDWLLPQRERAPLAGAPPADPPAFPDLPTATRWLDEERPGLLAAVILAAGQGWPVHAWQLAHELRVYLRVKGHLRDQLALHEVALDAVRQAGDRAGEVMVRIALGSAYVEQGRDHEALQQLEIALAGCRTLPAGDDTDALESKTLNLLGVTFQQLGRFPEALDCYQQAVSRHPGPDSDQQAPRHSNRQVHTNMGVLLVRLGELEAARESYQHALELCWQEGDRHGESLLLGNQGDVHRRLGRHQEALSYLKQSLAIADEHGFRTRRLYALLRLGGTCHDLGELDEALRHLEEARQLLGGDDRGTQAEGEVLVDLGAVYRDLGQLDRAADLVRTGLAVAVESGSRYLQAQALGGLAALSERAGEVAAAEEYRRQAQQLFTELGMPAPGVGVPPAAGERAGSAADRSRG